MKYGKNYFEPDEPKKIRLMVDDDFEICKELLRESEIAFRKEQIRFHLHLLKQRELGVNIPDMEVFETSYKEKEKFLEVKKKWRRDSIMMEMYLEAYPYVMFNGDYRGWKDIYERRYENPKDFCNYCNKEL